MLNLAAAPIFLTLAPTDMRKSFETLAARVRDHLGADPLSGSWYVFRNWAGDRLKILYWDGDGFALWQKRLAKGSFEFPKVIGAAVARLVRDVTGSQVAAGDSAHAPGRGDRLRREPVGHARGLRA